MAYDTYGRPLYGRSNGEPGYFGTHDSIPDYGSYHSAEPHDIDPSLRRKASTDRRHRDSPTPSDRDHRTPKAPEYADVGGLDGVSPEVLAELEKKISERVKREVVEHLKQTGTIDGQSKAPPMQRAPSNKSNSTSSPPLTARKIYTPPSPTQSAKTTYAFPVVEEQIPMRSPLGSPLDKPSGVRWSERNLPTRPAVGRSYSTAELSTVDQKWGRLFDSEGSPTTRLGAFLRGLANHIINGLPPNNSIVVTPAKMAAYYSAYPIDNEPHTLLKIFGTPSNAHISRLYQDLGCQHFLIQEDLNSPPTIPSLTPVGFAQWMTIHIMAYPEEEWARLSKVVLAWPIDADGALVDGKPERLPKQISRHLMPDREDRKFKQLMSDAILAFFDNVGSAPRRKLSLDGPAPMKRNPSVSRSRSRPVEIHQEKTSPKTATAQPIERERKPYSSNPTSEAGVDESIRIERERQPYSAQPGSGKVYTENANLNIPSTLGGTNSQSSRGTATGARERTTMKTDDEQQPRQGRGHSNSTAGQTYNPGLRTGRRTSSPPMKSFRHTSPEDIDNTSKYGPPPSASTSGFANSSQSKTFAPGSFGSTNPFPPPPTGPPPVRIHDIYPHFRDERDYKGNIDEDLRFKGEMNSPRDAERFDKYEEERREAERPRMPYTGINTRDPRISVDSRGAPVEDWYRKENGREGGGYGEYRRY